MAASDERPRRVRNPSMDSGAVHIGLQSATNEQFSSGVDSLSL